MKFFAVKYFMKYFINFTLFFFGFTLTSLTFLYVSYYLSFIYAHCSSLSLSAGLLAWFACLSRFTTFCRMKDYAGCIMYSSLQQSK